MLNNYNLYQNYFLQTLLNSGKDTGLDDVNIKLYKRLVLDHEFFSFLKSKYMSNFNSKVLEDESPKEEKGGSKKVTLRTSRVFSKSPNPIRPLDYGYFNKKLKCKRYKCFSPKMVSIEDLNLVENKILNVFH